MPTRIYLSFLRSDLEEKILNSASIFALICIGFPWISGSWLGGETMQYNGLQFYTSYIGFFIGACHLFILIEFLFPSLQPHTYGIPLKRETLRVWLAFCSTILSLAALSVLINIATEFTSMNIHFGIYGTLIGSLVSTIYALWTQHGHSNNSVQHRESRPSVMSTPPPPPPFEEHR